MSAVLEYGDIESVEQITQSGHRVALQKQRVRFGTLTLTRKWTYDGAPRVVLVHGFAQNRYTWHSSQRSFSAWLAGEGFEVWNFELRGHGLSRGETSSERFSDYVDDAARLSEALGPATWLGHSLGGAVSYAAATKAPVSGVVGIGALYSFAQANRALWALCQLSRVLGNSSGGGGIFGALNIRTELAGRLLGRLYSISDIAGYAFPISGWAPGSLEPDLLAERLARGFDWTSLNVWMDMARWGSSGVFEYDAAWGATDVPLLVIAGDLDHLMPPEDARVAYERSGSTDKTFTLLDDYETGHHWGHLDLVSGIYAPRWVWDPIVAWMRSRAPR